ncbi:DUF3579 domain-containing protein [Thiobacter aerophilum]|uniref:DUF3579 domain-containing protein n=1 Tax=Thiobacter aerophilum TaxID=3121275 RepID=A0ABV0EBU8_9BURK
MDHPDDYLIISSLQEDGKRLRPGDWVERISSALANFDEHRRLHYSTSVHPCIIEGEKCLVVARGLETADPAAYAFVMEFARANRLRILADRRSGARALPLPAGNP